MAFAIITAFTTCYEQHLLEIDVAMATNTILAKRNDLFTVGGHICLLKQPAGFTLCVLSSLTLFILDLQCNTIKYEGFNWILGSS